MEYDIETLRIAHYARQTHIVHPGKEALEWCRRNIDPYEKEIEDLVNMARVDADKKILKRAVVEASRYTKGHYRHISKYPEGYCLDITETVLDSITSTSPQDDHPAIELIGRMKEKDVPINRVYVTVTGENASKTFQNAIQFGNKIIDCSWDTGLNTNVRNVYVYDIEDHPYENIDSFEQYATVKSKYHTQRIFPIMQHMPYLAPMIPAIAVASTGAIEFIYTGDLFFQNLATGQRLARNFYQNSKFNESLPKKTREFLRRRCKEGVFSYFDHHSYTPEFAFELSREYYAGILTDKMPLEVKKERVDNGINIIEAAQNLSKWSQWEFD